MNNLKENILTLLDMHTDFRQPEPATPEKTRQAAPPIREKRITSDVSKQPTAPDLKKNLSSEIGPPNEVNTEEEISQLKLTERLRNPEALREAWLLKEILGPPKGTVE